MLYNWQKNNDYNLCLLGNLHQNWFITIKRSSIFIIHEWTKVLSFSRPILDRISRMIMEIPENKNWNSEKRIPKQSIDMIETKEEIVFNNINKYEILKTVLIWESNNGLNNQKIMCNW